MADMLSPGDFQDLDAPLTLDLAGGATPVTIALAVESVRTLPSHRMREAPFALVLRGPRAPLLRQAIYALTHPRLGRIDIFLVPIAQDAECARYEATFN